MYVCLCDYPVNAVNLSYTLKLKPRRIVFAGLTQNMPDLNKNLKRHHSRDFAKAGIEVKFFNLGIGNSPDAIIK
ncbi:hypothetical protein KIPB_014315, partial [Kipferlia bialata]|eukprot:g14315.t1